MKTNQVVDKASRRGIGKHVSVRLPALVRFLNANPHALADDPEQAAVAICLPAKYVERPTGIMRCIRVKLAALVPWLDKHPEVMAQDDDEDVTGAYLP